MIHTGNALEKKKELKRKDFTTSFSILSTVNIVITDLSRMVFYYDQKKKKSFLPFFFKWVLILLK